MKKTVGIIILFLIFVSCYFYIKYLPLAPSRAENIEQSDTFVEKKSSFTYKDQKIQYLLIFPAGYTQTATQWPMILFLHGSSLRGQNLELVKEYGPTWVAERRADFPCVVLAPQCPETEDWGNKTDILAALLEDILKRYRIDRDRIYLTGVSLGGRGTWDLACQHPEYFAAIAPIAAAKPKVPAAWDQQMISMPVWAFHGEKDTIAPLQSAERMTDALRNQGGNPRFTILSDQGHNIAGIYKKQELYDWFLTNHRTCLQR